MGFLESKALLTFGSGESPSTPQCLASNSEVDGQCGVAVVAFLEVLLVAFLEVVEGAEEVLEGGEEVFEVVDKELYLPVLVMAVEVGWRSGLAWGWVCGR